jgi:hypothetical protein
LKESRDYLIARYGAIVVHGIEADDAMGIEQAMNVAAQKEWDKLYGNKGM